MKKLYCLLVSAWFVSILCGGFTPQPGASTVATTFEGYNPNATPSSPSALDDEFGDDVFTWTAFNPSSTAVTTSEGSGLLRVNIPNQGAELLTGFYQVIPEEGVTDWTATATCALQGYFDKDESASLQGYRFGIIALQDAVADPEGSNAISVTVGYQNGKGVSPAQNGSRWASHFWTSYDTISASEIIDFRMSLNSAFFRMRFENSTSTIYTEISNGGRGFAMMDTTVLAFKPKHIGLGGLNNGQAAGISAFCDWFHFKTENDDGPIAGW